MGLEAGQERAFPILGPGKGGEGSGRDVPSGWIGPHPVDEIIPVLVGHADIADDHVGAELPEYGQGLGGGGGDGDLGLALGEDAADELAGVRLVIDDEHSETGECTILADVL